MTPTEIDKRISEILLAEESLKKEKYSLLSLRFSLEHPPKYPTGSWVTIHYHGPKAATVVSHTSTPTRWIYTVNIPDWTFRRWDGKALGIPPGLALRDVDESDLRPGKPPITVPRAILEHIHRDQ